MHLLTSASGSPHESLKDTMTQPWNLSQLCWWPSLAGVVPQPPLKQRWQAWGWVRKEKNILLLPLCLFSFRFDLALREFCGMRTSFQVGEWKWSDGLVFLRGRHTLSYLQGQTWVVPHTGAKWVVMSAFGFTFGSSLWICKNNRFVCSHRQIQEKIT